VYRRGRSGSAPWSSKRTPGVDASGVALALALADGVGVALADGVAVVVSDGVEVDVALDPFEHPAHMMAAATTHFLTAAPP
jgi:hypothetical protein